MRMAIVYNSVADEAGLEEQDTLRQAAHVESLARALGHEPLCLAVPTEAGILHLAEALARVLPASGAVLAFNLVESVDGSCRGAHQIPALLEEQGLACTGSDGAALLCSTNKLLAKHFLTRALLPHPEAVSLETMLRAGGRMPDAYILKSVWEHSSLGLNKDSVLQDPEPHELWEALAQRRALHGGDWFAERYIPGREFNLSLLEFEGGVQVLPPAEILFTDWEPGRPKIVDYGAKWLAGDPAFENTPRNFRFSEADEHLLQVLATQALLCWDAFDLSGYARVDFRVDEAGQPWIIDVNANPCLAPDAGFAAALQQAGITPARALQRILEAALRRGAARGLPVSPDWA